MESVLPSSARRRHCRRVRVSTELGRHNGPNADRGHCSHPSTNEYHRRDAPGVKLLGELLDRDTGGVPAVHNLPELHRLAAVHPEIAVGVAENTVFEFREVRADQEAEPEAIATVAYGANFSIVSS